MLWLYLKRWRLAVMALLLGIGSAAGIVLAGPLAHAGHTAKPRRVALGAVASSYQRWHEGRSIDSTQAHRGLELLSLAAAACHDLAYHGVQMVTWRGDGGSSRYIISVWHVPGASAIAQNMTVIAGGQQGAGDLDAEVSDSNALFISPVMLGLIHANFTVAYGGPGSAASRPSDVVELLRPGGVLAARFWVDQQTRLPLRREIFAPSGQVINDDAFIDLDIGSRKVGSPPAVQAELPGTAMTGTWIGALRRQGWPVPGSLGGSLAAVVASRSASADGGLVDVYYSDGLSVISLFMQRGDLPAQLRGWQVVAIGGYPVFAGWPAQRSFSWSARGFVYTVVANAPPGTVRLAVAGLPHDHVPGFFDRVGRGLKRISSWLNPFG